MEITLTDVESLEKNVKQGEENSCDLSEISVLSFFCLRVISIHHFGILLESCRHI